MKNLRQSRHRPVLIFNHGRYNFYSLRLVVRNEVAVVAERQISPLADFAASKGVVDAKAEIGSVSARLLKERAAVRIHAEAVSKEAQGSREGSFEARSKNRVARLKSTFFLRRTQHFDKWTMPSA
jgi:hypothetical protein